MDEAEVEHLVGLVEHQDFEFTKTERALVDEVEQPARGRDENVEAARDGAQALGVGNATENHADRQAHEPAIGLGAGGDLCRQLTGRREDQHSDVARLREFARGGEPVERWQHEGRGLAGAGLGDSEEIAAGEHRRDRLKLDGRRLSVIFRGERVEEGLRKPQGHE